MKLFAGAAALALLFGQGAECRRLAEQERDGGDGLEHEGAGQRRLEMTQAELDAFQEEEMLTTEEMDINATEAGEIDRLFAEMDTISEMIESASAECVEDASGQNPTDEEYDFDFNATEVTIPCGDEDFEIEELEAQLHEVQLELTLYLDGGEEGADGLDGGGLDGLGGSLSSDYVYDKFVQTFQKDGDTDLIPESAGLTREAKKAALKDKVKKANAHNAKAMKNRAKVKASKAKGKGPKKMRGLQQAEEEDDEDDTSIELINKFSDVPDEVFDQYYYADNEKYFREGHGEEEAAGTMEDSDAHRRRLSESERRALDDHVNQVSFTWKGTPQMGRVVSQGSCGSCYLNAAVTEFETALAIATGESPLSLSREQVKNCQKENKRYSWSTPSGCNGGWMKNSYEYIRRNWDAAGQTELKGGITTEDRMPYRAYNRECGYMESIMPKRAILGNHEERGSSYNYVSGSETRFKEALKDGPLTVALGASGWGGYGGGVKTCGSYQKSINHAVTLVGWGVDSYGRKYWEIQNSWGTWWGAGGFMKIYRGLNSDGSDKSSNGYRGDKGCGMTVYGGWQSNFPAKYDPNVKDCQGEFSPWSTCSDKCKGGEQTSTYSVTQAASGGGKACPYQDEYVKTRKCKYTKEVVTGEVMGRQVQADGWTTCTEECNGGKQWKQMRVARTDGETCTADEPEERICNTHMCPNTCLIVKDATYSWINGIYRQGTGTNPKDRCSDKTNTYFINDKAHRWYGRTQIFWLGRSCTHGYWVVYKSRSNRGWMYSNYISRGTTPMGVKWKWNNRNNMQIKAVKCDELPQDCEYHYEPKWSDCTATCGGGTQKKTLHIIKEDAFGGKVCPTGDLVRDCNTFSCDDKCVRVSKARYSFLNGVYKAVPGGFQQSYCRNEDTFPRYTRKYVRKYGRYTYTRNYDLVFYNSKCGYKYNGSGSNPRWTYISKGGDWAMGRVFKWASRTYVSSYDKSPWSSRKYIKPTDGHHPKNMDWTQAATMTNEWRRRGVTTVTEVSCSEA